MIYELLFPLSMLAVELNRQFLRHRAGNRDIYFEYETATRYRHNGRCVCTATHPDLDTNKTAAICAFHPSADSSSLVGPSPVPSSNTP